MKLTKTANKTSLKITKAEWEKIGNDNGWMKKAQSNPKWQQKLIDSPETGMGYQIADVILADGTVYKDVAISNCEHVSSVPGHSEIPFNVEDISDVSVTHNKVKPKGKDAGDV